jgi:chemotaxis signal transduction protein
MTIEPKQWFCLFREESGPMAVPVEFVAEIIETDTLVRLAWSPPQVVGMCSYHRDVVPVVKLGTRPRDVGDDLSRGHDQAVVTDSTVDRIGITKPTGCVVLILKTERGAWGIRVESEKTIMSRESPEYHLPRMCANGPVLIGIVRQAGTSYEILDAEATWRGLHAAVGSWCRLISGSNPSLPLPSGEAPRPEGLGVSAPRSEA